MSEKYITIGLYLGAKDEDLKRWYSLLKERELEQSFFIKQAILSHIAGKKIVLGKVCRMSSPEPIRTSFSVSITDTEIIDLFTALEKTKVKISPYLKRIIRSYLSLVGSQDEEFIPTYFDFNASQPQNLSSLFTLTNSLISNSKHERVESVDTIVIETTLDEVGENHTPNAYTNLVMKTHTEKSSLSSAPDNISSQNEKRDKSSKKKREINPYISQYV